MSERLTKRTDLPEDRAQITKELDGFEKAIRGEWYVFNNEPKCLEITRTSTVELAKINKLGLNGEGDLAFDALIKLCPNISKTARFVFPVQVIDYPDQVEIGENTFVNSGFVHLSAGKLKIGKNCFIGPNAHFYTPNHAIENLELRRAGWQYDLPIEVGDDVWFGGDVVVTPGVKIGNNVVVGAGSVVTKDIPDNCVIAGNPAKIVKQI